MLYGFSMDDVGYPGYSTPEHLENVLKMLEKNQLKGTFFVVPKVELKEYRTLLQEAVAAGHEIGQHGLTHYRFEVGIPPMMVLNAPHEKEYKEYLAVHRAEIESKLTVENIRKTLREGRNILEDFMQLPIRGFRAPCLQLSEALFEALALEGYQYDSSTWLQPYNWAGSGLTEPVKITRADFEEKQKPGLLELPLTADYVWNLPRERYQARMELALYDFRNIRQAGFPLVNLSHVSPIQTPDGTGLRFIAEWTAKMKAEDPDFRSLTLSSIAAQPGIRNPNENTK